MKIGIMTFWWSEDNYGQILQCYALQKYLRDAGHDAYLIRYDPRNDFVKTPVWKKIFKACNPIIVYNFLLNKKRILADTREKQDNPRYFGEFRNKHIKQSEKIYYSYQELKENPPEADVYIAGSDQIWNPDFLSIKKTNAQVRAYFLDFGSLSVRRIAYAASFSKERIDNDEYIRKITPLLHQFKYISVREKSGLDICKQCDIDTAEWVPDPTLLLDANIYRTLYKDRQIRKPEKPYCFLYVVGNNINFSIQTIYDWAKNRNLEVVFTGASGRYDKYDKYCATIYEWLYLIDNSEYVISNSFHCSVFSLLFQKKFGIIPLTGIANGTNYRLISLFDLCEINNRIIIEDFSVMDKNINWQAVSTIFQNIRGFCKLLTVI